MSLLDFLSDLANPSLTFLPRALLIAVLSSLVCGLVGAHVVLRGLSFVGDALSHAVFPGIAIAFALQGSILLGGAAAGILVAILISGSAKTPLSASSSLPLSPLASSSSLEHPATRGPLSRSSSGRSPA